MYNESRRWWCQKHDELVTSPCVTHSFIENDFQLTSKYYVKRAHTFRKFWNTLYIACSTFAAVWKIFFSMKSCVSLHASLFVFSNIHPFFCFVFSDYFSFLFVLFMCMAASNAALDAKASSATGRSSKICANPAFWGLTSFDIMALHSICSNLQRWVWTLTVHMSQMFGFSTISLPLWVRSKTGGNIGVVVLRWLVFVLQMVLTLLSSQFSKSEVSECAWAVGLHQAWLGSIRVPGSDRNDHDSEAIRGVLLVVRLDLLVVGVWLRVS